MENRASVGGGKTKQNIISATFGTKNCWIFPTLLSQVSQLPHFPQTPGRRGFADQSVSINPTHSGKGSPGKSCFPEQGHRRLNAGASGRRPSSGGEHCLQLTCPALSRSCTVPRGSLWSQLSPSAPPGSHAQHLFVPRSHRREPRLLGDLVSHSTSENTLSISPTQPSAMVPNLQPERHPLLGSYLLNVFSTISCHHQSSSEGYPRLTL